VIAEQPIYVERNDLMPRLEKAADGALGARASVVVISGDIGAGKSTLLNAFLARVDARDEAVVASVACDAHTTMPDLHAPGRLLTSLIGHKNQPPRWRRTKRVAQATGTALFVAGAEFAAAVMPPLAVIAPAGAAALRRVNLLSRLRRRDASDLGSSGVDAVTGYVTFFRAFASEQALVLAVDDIQNADEQTLSWISSLSASMERDPGLSLLLVLAYRDHDVGRDHPLHRALLEIRRRWPAAAIRVEMDENSSREFIQQYLETAGLEDGSALVERLHEKSRGNPLHVASMVRTLQEAGPVNADSIDWNMVPGEVAAAVELRLSGLGEREQELLEVAAVQGMEFRLSVLSEVLGDIGWDRPSQSAVRLLDRLASEHVLEDLGGSDSGDFHFRFMHPEFHNFVLARIGSTRRAHLHGSIGDALLRIDAADPALSETIADHLLAAGRSLEAHPFLVVAAEQALELGSYRSARGIAERALPIEFDVPTERSRLLCALARAVAMEGFADQSIPHARESLRLARSASDSLLEVEALIQLAFGLRRRSPLEALPVYDEALALARSAQLPLMEAKSLIGRGVTLARLGEYDDSLQYQVAAGEILEQYGAIDELVTVLNNRGVALGRRGDFAGALELYQEAEAIARESGHMGRSELYLRNQAAVLIRMGRFGDARLAAEEAVSTARRAGKIRGEAMGLNVLGWALAGQGELEEARGALREALDLLDEHAPDIGRAQTWLQIKLSLLLLVEGSSDSVHRASMLAEAAAEVAAGGVLEFQPIRPEALISLAAMVMGDLARARTSVSHGQLIRGGDNAWWEFWQDAAEGLVRAVVDPAVETPARVRARYLLARTRVDAPGFTSVSEHLLKVVERLPGSTSVVEAARAALREPLRRSDPIETVRDEAQRLNALTDRLRGALNATQLSRFQTPCNLEAERERFLAGYSDGRLTPPSFQFDEIPNEFEAPLVRLLDELDPVRSVWDEMIYEEIEDHLDLVRSMRLRDSAEIDRASADRYGRPSEWELDRARELANPEVEVPPEVGDLVPAEMFAERIRSSLRSEGLPDWSVEVAHDMVARASIRGTEKLVRIASGAQFTTAEAERLLVHEVGTHVFRAANGERQLLKLLGVGLGRNLATEEGMAAINEKRAGLLDTRTLRRYALRTLAVDSARRRGFSDVFSEIVNLTDPQEAFSIAVRVKRGMQNPEAPGAFNRDHTYLEGFLKLDRIFEWKPESHRLLMAAKIGVARLGVLEALEAEGLLRSPAYMPKVS